MNKEAIEDLYYLLQRNKMTLSQFLEQYIPVIRDAYGHTKENYLTTIYNEIKHGDKGFRYFRSRLTSVLPKEEKNG